MAGSRTAVLRKVIQSVAEADRPTATDRELLRRFAREGDQAAFEALVSRHTAMVLGVCRRVLPTVQDAEDACQATFLVLANKAKSGRWQESVANWLYTTARKLAHNARLAAERRAKRESKVAVPEAVEPVDRMTVRELLTVLDEELSKLAPRYREPLVLCHLEGLTLDEAAAQLCVPVNTLKTRTARARKQLADALTKRGCALGVGLLTLAVTSPAGASSPRLVKSILAAASGSVPAAVSELAKGVAVNGVFNKSVFALVVVGIVALGAGLGSLGTSTAGQPAESTALDRTSEDRAKPAAPAAPAEQPAVPPGKDSAEKVPYRGRVVGPDGKPVAGAKLYLAPGWGFHMLPYPSPEYAATGTDGRFEFVVPKAKYGDGPVIVSAAAAGHGVGWLESPAGGKRDDLSVQLVEDTPITGAIIDLQGKPVAGATLRVLQVMAAPKEDLAPWLDAVRDKKGLSRELERQYFPRYTLSPSPQVVTDAEGHFKLTGMGRNRIVVLRLDGPMIATQYLRVVTRPGKSIEVLESRARPEYDQPAITTTYYGAADFRHPAPPSRPIVGALRDADTKKPLAGFTIQGGKPTDSGINGLDFIRTTTDKQGRYRLTGLRKGDRNSIVVLPPDDVPYLAAEVAVSDVGPALDPLTLDVELKRGVWIEGKITDKLTGKPVRAMVGYHPLKTNPNLSDYHDLPASMNTNLHGTKENGSYRIVGLPGPGVVGVWNRADYLRASERDDEFGAKN